MVIEELKPSKRVRDRWLAVLEDGSILRVSRNQIADFALYAGRALSDEEADRLIQAVQTENFRAYALQTLLNGPKSRKMLLELLAKKDCPPEQAGEIRQEPFLLNTRNRTLEKNGQRVKLTQVEYSIMKMFMENPGKALSREEILDTVWGRDYFGELKIVDVNIRRLRIKIEDNAQKPTFVNTVWGYGYKWGS